VSPLILNIKKGTFLVMVASKKEKGKKKETTKRKQEKTWRVSPPPPIWGKRGLRSSRLAGLYLIDMVSYQLRSTSHRGVSNLSQWRPLFMRASVLASLSTSWREPLCRFM
jgi:hypothetical protein